MSLRWWGGEDARFLSCLYTIYYILSLVIEFFYHESAQIRYLKIIKNRAKTFKVCIKLASISVIVVILSLQQRELVRSRTSIQIKS